MKAIQRRGRGEMDLNLSQNRQEHYKSVVRTFSCADGKMKHVENIVYYCKISFFHNISEGALQIMCISTDISIRIFLFPTINIGIDPYNKV